MSYYRYEKKHLKNLDSRICMGFFLFCFLLNVVSGTEAAADNVPEPIRFSLPLCFIFLGACLALTNSTLFFSREQNERIFLLHKYRFVPADLQKMFRAKAMLLLRELLIFLLLSLAVYLFIVLGKYGTKAELAEPLCFFLSIAVFGLVFSGVELALNAVLLRRSEL